MVYKNFEAPSQAFTLSRMALKTLIVEVHENGDVHISCTGNLEDAVGLLEEAVAGLATE